MAEVQETRVLPAEYIEALGKTYASDLTKAVGGLKTIDLTKLYGPKFVAGPGGHGPEAHAPGGPVATRRSRAAPDQRHVGAAGPEEGHRRPAPAARRWGLRPLPAAGRGPAWQRPMEGWPIRLRRPHQCRWHHRN